MKQFFDEIKGRVYAAIRADIARIVQQSGGEDIYSAALVTDEDCISLYLAANSREYLKKKDTDTLAFMRQYLTAEKARAVESGADSLTEWNPAEWGYYGGKDSGLAEVSRLLFEQERLHPQEYAESKPLFFQTITSAFRQAIDDKLLDGDSVVFFITMSDGGGAEEIENQSARQLNSAAMFEKFSHRFGGK